MGIHDRRGMDGGGKGLKHAPDVACLLQLRREREQGSGL